MDPELHPGDCTGWLCVPTGPGTPFAGWVLGIADTIRLAVIVGGGAAILLTVTSAIRSSVTQGQRTRMAGLGMFCLVAINTEVNRLGDLPSGRLALTVAAVSFSLHGMWSFRTREHPSQPRTTGSGDAV